MNTYNASLSAIARRVEREILFLIALNVLVMQVMMLGTKETRTHVDHDIDVYTWNNFKVIDGIFFHVLDGETELYIA